MAFIVHRALGEQTLLRQIPGDELRIGRGTNAELRLEDAAVAHQHAVVRAAAGGWELVDLGSVTGTYVHGRAIKKVALADGDRIEIGGFRLRVQITHPEDPLFVHVAAVGPGAAAAPRRAREGTGTISLSALRRGDEAPADVAPAGPSAAPPPSPPQPAAPPSPSAAVAPRAVDWVAAYRVGRGLGLARLTVALALLAALAVAALAAVGATAAFMPGISSAHRRLIVAGGDGGAAPAADPRAALPAAHGCASCHRPWRGPADAACGECHRPQAAPHAELLAAGAAAGAVPACRSCHPEHRPDEPLIELAADGPCVACHRDLAALPGAAGAIRVAAEVTSFAAAHPELVSPARAAAGDPTALDFGHRKHLAPGLRGPAGAESLGCESCHLPDPETGRMQPVSFADHCQRCHRLTFDPAFPERQAPHGDPQLVEDFLIGLYSRGGGEAAASLRQRRLDLISGGGGRQELPSGIDRQVSDAARTLFGSACDTCHRVDLDAQPLPAVTPPAVPERWLDARFSHLDHREAACDACHAGAAASDSTADLLLPGIAACRECHGDRPGAGVAGWGGALGCAQCHPYHRQTGVKEPVAGSRRPGEARSP